MIMQLHREYDDNIKRHLSDIWWNLEEKWNWSTQLGYLLTENAMFYVSLLSCV